MNIYIIFDSLRYHYENEVVEFKKAENHIGFDDLGKYTCTSSSKVNLKDKELALQSFGVHDNILEIIDKT